MAKQTAAAQKRTEAEARKAAKLVASSAAASSQVDPLSSQAGEAAGSHASKATVGTASGMSLALTGTSAATAKQLAGGPKAELHVAADSSQQEDLATATDSSDRPQLTLGSGDAAKSTVAGASTDQDENQASNGLAPGGAGQPMTSSDDQAGSGKGKPGKKRAAEALGTEGGPRGGHSRSTRSKTCV